MPKKQMKFKDGGKVKHYYTGSQVSKSSGSEDSSDLRGEALPPVDEMESINAGVRRALAGERPSAPEYTQLPESKDNKFVKAANKIQKSQAADPRMLEAITSRGRPSAVSQIPGQSLTAEQREGISKGERVSGTELGRNVSNTLSALTPLGGGVGKIGAELALGNRAAKAATASKMSPSGQRLANMEEVRKVAMPGRAEAVMNPSAWAGGPKAMDKIAQVEARAAQAEAKAAQTAARKKAAQAKKDAKDPVLSARPGADKAKKQTGYKYESEQEFPPMYKKGGAIKKFAKGGSVSSASSRADGIAIRGKTKGTMSKMCGGGMYKGKK